MPTRSTLRQLPLNAFKFIEMTDILIIFFLLSIGWHFVYEGILAPSLRLQCRFRLFELRDQLRAEREENGADFPDEVFLILDDMINVQLGSPVELTPSNLIFFRRALKNDPDLRAFIDERMRIVDNCPIDYVTSFRKRLTTLHTAVLGINVGGWAFYIIPLLVCWLLARLFQRFLYRSLFAPAESIASPSAAA